MTIESVQKPHVRDIFSTSPPIKHIMKDRPTISSDEATDIIQNLEEKLDQQITKTNKLKEANQALMDKVRLYHTNLNMQEQLVICSQEQQKKLNKLIPAITKQFEENLKLEMKKTEEAKAQIKEEMQKNTDLRRQLGLTSKKIEKQKRRHATELEVKAADYRKLEEAKLAYENGFNELQIHQQELTKSLDQQKEITEKLQGQIENLKKSNQTLNQQKNEIRKELTDEYKTKEKKLNHRIEDLTSKNIELQKQVDSLKAAQNTKPVLSKEIIEKVQKTHTSSSQEIQKTQDFFQKHHSTILTTIFSLGVIVLSHALLRARDLSLKTSGLIGAVTLAQRVKS